MVHFDSEFEYMYEHFPLWNEPGTSYCVMRKLDARTGGIRGRTGLAFTLPADECPSSGDSQIVFHRKTVLLRRRYLCEALAIIHRAKQRMCALKFKRFTSMPDWREKHPVKLQALIIYALRKKIGLPREISRYLYKTYLRGHILPGCVLRLP